MQRISAGDGADGTDASTAAGELRTRVAAIVGQMCPSGPAEVSSADRLVEDLGFDSLAIIELSLVLEAEFGLQPLNEKNLDISTVDDVARLVERLRPAE